MTSLMTAVARDEGTEQARRAVGNDDFATPSARRIARAPSTTACLADVAAANATRLAVVDQRVRWSYRELLQRAAAVAARVREARGAGAEPVALLCPHAAPMIAALLGVLGAGKAYVPLVPDEPAARLQAIVRACGARLVLAAPEFEPLARTLGIEVMVLDDAAVADCPLGPRDGQSLSYVLHTSGTTGVPKGVLQNDRHVLHHAACYADALSLHADDRMTLLPYYAFDASVMDIFATLLTGACLCIWDIRRDGVAGLDEWLARQEVTVWHSTPSVLRTAFPHFVQSLALRWVVLGGEAATGHDAALARRHAGPACRLLNGLGPTECTTALQYVARPGLDDAASRLPVGRPVPGVRVLLLDPDGRESAAEGELVIESEHVALGYWGREDLSAERFAPAGDGSPRRRYRTGDVVRWNAEGQLEHLTRVDDQVKIRGVRIELGEVQAALSTHPAIAHALVLALRDDPAREPVLVGYVVAAARGAAPDAAALRAHLAARLPAAMVPAAFVVLDAFPLLANGKVDRRALPPPAEAEPATGEAPQTPLQKMLAAIWREVLQREVVHLDDNFFALGGESLRAMRVVAAVRARLEAELQLADVFEHPTLRRLASRMALYAD
ncbi:MAG TPA: non-ribosomal peptide synthetase [Burkholderiaceae bacterium]